MIGGVGRLLLAGILLLVGCAEEPSQPEMFFPGTISVEHSDAVIPEVNANELEKLVSESQRPVLVEFSVLSGCYRCDDMRSPIRGLASSLQKTADVVRIDFNLNQKLAREVGATVCPSYVLYSSGEVANVRTWPTSADFVARDIEELVAVMASSRETAVGLESPEVLQ